MKKLLRVALVLGVVFSICGTSCVKNYHCVCTYNNQIRMDKYMGARTKDNAVDECEGYDSTVAGEKWTCTLR